LPPIDEVGSAGIVAGAVIPRSADHRLVQPVAIAEEVAGIRRMHVMDRGDRDAGVVAGIDAEHLDAVIPDIGQIARPVPDPVAIGVTPRGTLGRPARGCTVRVWVDALDEGFGPWGGQHGIQEATKFATVAEGVALVGRVMWWFTA